MTEEKKKTKNLKVARILTEFVLTKYREMNEKQLENEIFQMEKDEEELLIEEISKKITNHMPIQMNKEGKINKRRNTILFDKNDLKSKKIRNVEAIYLTLLKFKGLKRYMNYQGLCAQDIRNISCYIKHQFYPKGSYIVRQYDKSTALYGIINGSCEVREIETFEKTKNIALKISNDNGEDDEEMEKIFKKIPYDYFLSDNESDNDDNDNDNDNNDDNENNDNNNNSNKDKENKNEPLSQMTLELLSLKTEEAQLKFLEENKTTKVLIRNYITCINYIKKDNSNDLKTSSYLIVGTETCLIYVIDHNNKTPLLKKRIYEVPFIIETQGGYNAEHKIFVSDRGCNVYILKKDIILNKFIMPQPLVNLLISKNNFYIGTIGNNYISYTLSGNIVFKINQPSIITCMEIYYRKSEDLNIIIIALKNKEVRFYNDKKLIIIMNVHDNIFGMKYGKFQMTEDCLVLSTYSGIIMIKNFGNDIKFSEIKYEEKKKEEGKILVPKKSPLYLDLIEREKENSFHMQNTFQNDLLRIRYKAMDSYVKMLKIGNAPQNYSSSSTIKISGFLEGLGPNFKLNLILDNSAHEPIINAVLTLDYNRKVFYFDKENIILSIIMPHVPIKYSLPFKNISENGSSGMIKIIIIDKFKNSPLIQSTIKVPVSELEML